VISLSSDSFPCSTNCITAIVPMSFVQEASHIVASSGMGSCFDGSLRERWPNAFWYLNVPEGVRDVLCED
jgi:hypothetical protein